MTLAEFQKWLKPAGSTMLTTDAKALSPFLNNLSYTMGLMSGYITMLKAQKQVATDLIQSIKENYSSKNE